MNFWLDLFSGTTWEEFQAAGAAVSGFRHTQVKAAEKIQPGDIFLCYMTGVQRWVGALEVLGPSNDTTPIWKDEDFPVRFAVKPLVVLDAEHGIPMQALEGRVSFFEDPGDVGKFKGFIRQSLRAFASEQEGSLIMDLLRQAEANPVARSVDPKKLLRKPYYTAQTQRGKRTVPIQVTIPEPEPEPEQPGQPAALATDRTAPVEDAEHKTSHTEMQHLLATLGREIGLDVWVARNDRSRIWKGEALGEIPGVLMRLPTQFNEATNRTIELIDVLWLKDNNYVAAFEVECTTSVYSGLLRMSDLLSLQPNLTINLFIVADEDKRNKVQQEILRPTFSLSRRPLHKECGFLSFNQIADVVSQIRRLGFAASLNPDFLTRTAEYFDLPD